MFLFLLSVCDTFNRINNRVTSVSSECCNIIDSQFTDLSNNAGGGAIYINQPGKTLLISKCTFFNCRTSNLGGGGIFFVSEKSFISKTCGYWCYTPSPDSPLGNLGQFLYSETPSLGFSTIEFVSISHSSPTIEGNYRSSPFCFHYGIQLAKNTNSSKNQIGLRSCCFFLDSTNSTNTFSTFYSNYASYLEGVVFTNGINFMSYSNVVNNNQAQNHAGVIRNWDNPTTTIDYCVFCNNHNRLFSVEYGTMNVRFSSIYGSYTTNGAVLISCSTNSYTHELVHYNTYYCIAENPLIENTNAQSSPIKKSSFLFLTLFL